MLKMNTQFMVGPRLFDSLEIKYDPRLSGFAHREEFANGWGISVVCHGNGSFGTYGYDLRSPEFEIAVVSETGLRYRNPVTPGDVRGYLSAAQVDEAVATVASWPTIAPEEDWECPARRPNSWSLGLGTRDPVPEPGYRSSAYSYINTLLAQDY